jgi:hypothetical protein
MVGRQSEEEAAMRPGLEPSDQRPTPAGSGAAGVGAAPARWPLIRDVLFLQPKLVLEGLKDLLLGPISLVAALLDLILAGRPGRKRLFYGVLRLARGFESWLNLYGSLPPERSDEKTLARTDPGGIDAYFGKIETALVQEHERGGRDGARQGERGRLARQARGSDAEVAPTGRTAYSAPLRADGKAQRSASTTRVAAPSIPSVLVLTIRS